MPNADFSFLCLYGSLKISLLFFRRLKPKNGKCLQILLLCMLNSAFLMAGKSDNTVLIQLNNPKALAVIKELEALDLIDVLEENIVSEKPKLSEKYRGKLPAYVAEQIQQSIKK